jgi:hypothetical protein
MAVIAVESKLAGVQLVAGGDGLDGRVSCIDYRRVGVLGEGGDRDHRADAGYGTCDL